MKQKKIVTEETALTQITQKTTTTSIDKKTKSSQDTVLAFYEIESSDKYSTRSKQISEKIYKSLFEEKKEKLIVRITGNTNNAVPSSKLIGRMHKIGDRFILTVKIISSVDSSIKFSKTISFSEDKNINDKIDELSKSIIQVNSLWKESH